MDEYLQNTLYNLTHRDRHPSYCLIDKFTETIGDYDKKDLDKVIELIQFYGYDVYIAGRQDELDDTYLIVDKDCNLNDIKDDYINFFSVDVILTKVDTKEDIEYRKQIENLYKKGVK